MTTPIATPARPVPDIASSARPAILWAGLACGVLDITAAMTAASLKQGTPLGVLQSVASGLLGRSSFQGGAATAALGLLLHFGFAFAWAALFYALSRRFPSLLRGGAIAAGLVYGAFVYLVMYWGVIPLGAVIRRLYLPDVVVRFPPLALQPLVIHLLFVGLPIALVIRHFSRRPSMHG